MTDLLPCPFCGAEPFHEPDPDSTTGIVSCENRHCHVNPSVERDHEEDASGDALAIAAWNERAKAPAPVVKLPDAGLNAGVGPQGRAIVNIRDREWIAALKAAGIEVINPRKSHPSPEAVAATEEVRAILTRSIIPLRLSEIHAESHYTKGQVGWALEKMKEAGEATHGTLRKWSLVRKSIEA